MVDSRNLDNPLFDLWLNAVTPYYQREKEHFGDGWALEYLLRFDLPSLDGAVAVEKAVNEASPLSGKDRDIEALTSPFTARHELVISHSWAIPTEEAIDKIVEHSPAGVVEIGAGTGYWARLIRARGTHMQAYDEKPHANDQAKAKWSPVRFGGPGKAALWPQMTLFLCWPPYNTPMASRCLDAYVGSKFIYVGESGGGCNGDEEFHEILEREWNELEDEYVAIPRWPGIRDGLYVYERKHT